MDLLYAMRDLGVADPVADTVGEETGRETLAQEIDQATVARRPTRWGATRLLRRPHVLAGSSLSLAGIAAALVVVLGGSAAPPAAAAFAVTREADGSVLVTLSTPQAIVGADRQLVAMGIKEQVMYQTAPGAATSSAPVACKLVLGPGDYAAAPKSAGPPVRMRLGTDNTGTAAGNSGPGSASGTVHLASCVSYPEGPGTQLGNSGQAFLNHYGG